MSPPLEWYPARAAAREPNAHTAPPPLIKPLSLLPSPSLALPLSLSLSFSSMWCSRWVRVYQTVRVLLLVVGWCAGWECKNNEVKSELWRGTGTRRVVTLSLFVRAGGAKGR